MSAAIAHCFGDAVCSNASSFAVTLDFKHDESADEVQQLPAIKVRPNWALCKRSKVVSSYRPSACLLSTTNSSNLRTRESVAVDPSLSLAASAPSPAR